MILFTGVLCVCFVVGVCGEEWSIEYLPKSACGFVGDSVYMFCYTNPRNLSITEVYWTKHNYTDPPPLRDDPEYSNRIREGCNHEKKYCVIVINLLTKLDMGEYYCRITTSIKDQNRIGTPGIYLDVKGNNKQNVIMLV